MEGANRVARPEGLGHGETANGGIGGRGGTAFGMLLACSFAASFGQSMMNIALPSVARDFHVTLSQANWLIVGYMVVAAVSIMLTAFLLRRLGLRRVFFIGGFAMLAGSALALAAPNLPTLLGCRLVQAVCTGLFYPMVTSAIMQNSPPERRGARLALNSGVIAVGLSLSPVVSGALITYLGWRAMFCVPCALSACLLVAGRFFVRGDYVPERIAVDVPSVVLGLSGLSALMYGLGEVTHDAAPSLAAIAAGAAVLALFAWRQTRLREPLLNVRPLGNARFSVGILLVMMGMMTSYSMSVLLPLYYEGAAGFTPFSAGLLLVAPILVNAVFTYVGGVLYDRCGVWPLVPAGMLVVLVGLASAFAFSGHVLAAFTAVSSALVYAGIGFVVAPSKASALSQLPPSLYAHGASINSTGVQVGSAIGSSLFVGVLSADVLHETAVGLAKEHAYALGFSHTLLVVMLFAAAALALTTWYARKLHKEHAR